MPPSEEPVGSHLNEMSSWLAPNPLNDQVRHFVAVLLQHDHMTVSFDTPVSQIQVTRSKYVDGLDMNAERYSVM
jgi:hypothetical protein